MPLARLQTRLSDQPICSHTLELGQIRGRSIGDYHVIERDNDTSPCGSRELVATATSELATSGSIRERLAYGAPG